MGSSLSERARPSPLSAAHPHDHDLARPTPGRQAPEISSAGQAAPPTTRTQALTPIEQPARARSRLREHREPEPEPPAAVEAPIEFGEGLLARESLERSLGRFHALEGRFATELTTPEARIAELQQLVNAEIQAIGAPPVTMQMASIFPDLGRFDPNRWQILVDRSLLTGPVNEMTFTGLVNTLVHESRHCEQWWLIARTMRMERGRSAQGIPSRITSAAYADTRPLSPQQMQMGRDMTVSMHDEAGQARMRAVHEAIMVAREAQERARAAREALRANDTWRPEVTAEQAVAANQRLQEADQQFRQAYETYHSLPHEADAHRVGDTASRMYRMRSAS